MGKLPWRSRWRAATKRRRCHALDELLGQLQQRLLHAEVYGTPEMVAEVRQEVHHLMGGIDAR